MERLSCDQHYKCLSTIKSEKRTQTRMGGKRNCIWHIFKNIISGRKIQFNFQNDWLNQSMTGLYNQYLLPLTLAAFLERSFSKIVLFSATFHCVLCKLFWLVYCVLFFFIFFASTTIKNLTNVLHEVRKNRYFAIPVCILFLRIVNFNIIFNVTRDRSKYFPIFRVLVDNPNPALTPILFITVIYPLLQIAM